MGDSSEDEQIDDEYDDIPSELSKELVHKSHSDPGKGSANRPPRCPLPSGPTTRKCVLTLDGYSYVIGKTFYFTFTKNISLQLKQREGKCFQKCSTRWQ
jgi:hypothetical protein